MFQDIVNEDENIPAEAQEENKGAEDEKETDTDEEAL